MNRRLAAVVVGSTLLFTYALGDEKAETLMVREDDMAARAVEAMGRAQSLQETARKTIAQRTGTANSEP